MVSMPEDSDSDLTVTSFDVRQLPPSISWRCSGTNWRANLVHSSKVAFRVVCSMYGFLFFWIGGWNLAAAWHDGQDLISRIVYCVAGLLVLCVTDTLYAQGGMDGFMLDWEPLYLRYRLILPLRIFASCSAICFMWVGLYELMAIHIPPNSYDTTLYGTPAVLAKDITLVVIGLLVSISSRTFFIGAFVPLEVDDSCSWWAKYSAPMEILPHHSATRHVGASLLAILGLGGQSAFWLGLSNLLENHSDQTLNRELVYVGLGFMVYVMTRTVQARAYISIDGIPIEGMQPMAFGPAAIALALISFVAQYVHLIGAWTALGYETIPWSNERDCAYVVGGVALMMISGTLRAWTGVGYAPVEGAEMPFQSARSTRGMSVYDQETSFWLGNKVEADLMDLQKPQFGGAVFESIHENCIVESNKGDDVTKHVAMT